MSYESYPASPEPGPTGPTARAVPPSVKLATTLILVGIGLSLVSVLATFLYIDDIVDTIIDDGNAGGTSRDTLKTSAIVGSLVFFAISAAIQVAFFFLLRKGANWARIVYVVLTGLSLLYSLFSVFGQPILLLLLGLVSIALSIAIIVLLFRPDSNAFFSGKGQGPRPGDPGYGQNQY